MSTTNESKSYQGFSEKTYASRKGRLCFIKKIHFEMNPPSVTVQMMDNDCEVGTEFDRLRPINAWFCSICTAQNTDTNANKCDFCKINRNYKEKISIVEDSQPSKDTKEPIIEPSQNMEHSQSDCEELNDTDHSDSDSDSAQDIETNMEQLSVNDNSTLCDSEEEIGYESMFDRQQRQRQKRYYSPFHGFNGFDLW